MIPMRHVPNALTGLRVLFVPVIVVILLDSPNETGRLIAAGLFLLAWITDLVDGWLARSSHSTITTFGKLADPVADKLLVISALVSLAILGRIAVWVVIVIVARELAVTVLRWVAIRQGNHEAVISAGRWGKIKTTAQDIMIVVLIAMATIPAWFNGWIYLTVAITIGSGAGYFVSWYRQKSLERSSTHMETQSVVRLRVGVAPHRFFDAMCGRLVRLGVTPNRISLTGLVLNLVAAGFIFENEFWVGGLVFIAGSVLDTLDGRFARRTGLGTPFGAFLDSTLDRMEEGIVLTAVAMYFVGHGNKFGVSAIGLAIVFSLIVSYTRARAEGLGITCKTGLATRPIRVVIISAGLIFAQNPFFESPTLLTVCVAGLAGLTALTVLQRLRHVQGEFDQLDHEIEALAA